MFPHDTPRKQKGARSIPPPIVTPEMAPKTDWEDRFEPELHDGNAAIGQLLLMLENQIGTRSPDDPISNTYAIGVGALHYLRDAVGIDPGAALNRWSRLPPFFVPKHVSDKHGMNEKDSKHAICCIF